MSEKKVEEKTMKATEGKVEDKQKMDQVTEDIQKEREKSRESCLKEIDGILTKYNCILTARMIVGERGNVSQVFLMDRPQDGKG
jgi:hypothetical protein